MKESRNIRCENCATCSNAHNIRSCHSSDRRPGCIYSPLSSLLASPLIDKVGSREHTVQPPTQERQTKGKCAARREKYCSVFDVWFIYAYKNRVSRYRQHRTGENGETALSMAVRNPGYVECAATCYRIRWNSEELRILAGVETGWREGGGGT